MPHDKLPGDVVLEAADLVVRVRASGPLEIRSVRHLGEELLAGAIVLLDPWAGRVDGQPSGGSSGTWDLIRESREHAVAQIAHPGVDGSVFPYPHAVRVEIILRLGRLEIG